MFTKIKSYFSNFNVLSFAKFMSIVIILIASINLVIAYAGGPQLADLTWDNVKASLLEFLVGLFFSSLTIIVGYAVNLLRYGVTHLYDVIRTYIANTQILEVLADLKDFCMGEIDIIENMVMVALKNDNKIDDKELNEIAQKVVEKAMAVWGEKKITYLAKYRPMLKEWLLVKAKAIIRELVESFRAKFASRDTAINNTTK